MKSTVTLALALCAALPAGAELKTREVVYKQGETELQGYFAWDDAAPGKRPGVVVVHEWWGHNAHARHQAERLAREGYVAFALDMYGKGKVTTHPADAQAFATEAASNLGVLTARFEAALAQLEAHPSVDPERIAALGYCFGGSVVLGMARAGADLDAVVTFHAGIAPVGPPAGPGTVKARLLVLNGADDAMVTQEQLAAFRKEMEDAKARFEIVNLPGARHSFTNPDADKVGIPNLAYSAEADARSWAAMKAMLAEVFAEK